MSQKDAVLYIQMIDDIRKQKQIPLEAFIADITSERSYRRYLNKELHAPLETLEKLINRLGVDFTDILFYTLTIKRTPSGIIEFITYMHVDELELATPYYEKLLTYKNAHEQLLMLVHAYLKWYEYRMGTIGRASFIDYLSSQVSYYLTHPYDTNEALALIILYHKFVPDQTMFQHEAIQQLLLEKDLHLIQILLYDIMFDQYLHTLLRQPSVDTKQYIKLASHATHVTQLWLDAIYIYAGYFHKAMIFHYQQDIPNRNLYFMKYLSYRTNVLSYQNVSDNDTFIENIVGMDIPSFKKMMFHQLLLNKKT